MGNALPSSAPATRRTLRAVAALWVAIGGAAEASAQEFEGRYRGAPGTMRIGRRADGTYALQVQAMQRGGVCGSFDAPGSVRGNQFVATAGQGAEACRLTVTPSGDQVTVRASGDGCIFLHGASCPGFEGSYRRTGGAPRAAPPSSGGWRLDGQRGNISARARNLVGSAQLVLGCAGPAGQRFLTLSMQGAPRGWRVGGIGDTVSADIGGARFDLLFEGGADSAAISLKGQAPLRLSAEFIAALRRGPALILSGRQLAAVNERERTFPLGGREALDRVVRNCQ